MGTRVYTLEVWGGKAPPLPPHAPPPLPPPFPPSPPPVAFYTPPDCVNGPGQTWTVAEGTSLFECETITVQGTFVVSNHTLIRARRFTVEEGGVVTVGTEAPYAPALNVTLHLDHADCESLSGAAQEECLKDGRLDVYGEWESFGVPRTAWSQLTADCDSCATLAVEECRGWEVGDRLVIAPSSARAFETNAPTRIVASVAHDGDGRSCSVALNESLAQLHRGSTHKGAPMHAEVVNYERSIVVTGPPMFWRGALSPPAPPPPAAPTTSPPRPPAAPPGAAPAPPPSSTRRAVGRGSSLASRSTGGCGWGGIGWSTAEGSRSASTAITSTSSARARRAPSSAPPSTSRSTRASCCTAPRTRCSPKMRSIRTEAPPSTSRMAPR